MPAQVLTPRTPSTSSTSPLSPANTVARRFTFSEDVSRILSSSQSVGASTSGIQSKIPQPGYVPRSISQPVTSSDTNRIQAFKGKTSSGKRSRPAMRRLDIASAWSGPLSFTDDLKATPEIFKVPKISTETENTEILPDKLYLGTLRDALSPEYIKKHRITAVVTAMLEPLPQNYTQRHGLKTVHISCADSVGANLIEHMDKMFDFIEDNERVLVHCHAGVSRSAAICASYLIRKNRWSLSEALRFLESKRACVAPNFSFLGQLSVYAERWQSSGEKTE